MSDQIEAPPRETPKTRPTIGAQGIALIVASAFFMQNLDGAIINTSLPQMAASFRVGVVDVNIGITAYILAVGAFVPMSAWASDRFGAKNVFAAAIVVFTLASAACAFATDLTQFVIARVVQGMGGALMTPVGRIVVLRNAKKTELVQATALITWPALIAPVVGPVLGGAITTFLDWRWNFLLNLPLGLIGLLLVIAYIPNHREEGRTPLDLFGALLAGMALSLLILGLERLAQSDDWRLSAACLLGGAAFAAGAVTWFRRAKHPLLDLSPLKEPTFSISSLDAGNFFRVSISATPFLLPLLLMEVWMLNPLQAGGYVLVYFLGNLAMKTVTTVSLRKLGFRDLLVWNGVAVGLTVAACGFLTPGTPAVIAGTIMFLAGATRSMQFTALNTLTFAETTQEQRAAASTLSSMLQQVAMALGVASAAILLSLSQANHGGARVEMEDFRFAFIVCGAFALVGSLLMLRLKPDAGAEVSGHTPRVRR